MLCGADANSSNHQAAWVYVSQMRMRVHAREHAGDTTHTPAVSFYAFLINRTCSMQGCAPEEAEDSKLANINVNILGGGGGGRTFQMFNEEEMH